MLNFDTFWEEYQRRAHAACLFYLKDICPDDAHDVCAEVYSACRNKVEGKTEQQLWWYVRRACKNKSLTWLERKLKAIQTDAEFFSRVETLTYEESSAMQNGVRTFIGSNILTEDEHQALISWMHDWPYKETAKLMGCSVSTVKRRTKDALAKAKAYIRRSL